MPTSGPTYSHAAFASGTNHTRIDQRITPHNLPAPADANQVREAWFYSAIFGTRFGGGGYIGIQKDSNGQRAIFSIWNSLSAGTFDPAGQVYYGTNEPPGTYYRITIPYNWVAGHLYELSIRKSTTPNYWDGWITDITTGTAKQIGYQQVPAGWGDLHESIDNFVEWFGSQPSACDKYPYCSVTFSLPTSSVGPATWVRADENNGACPATITADGTGKRHELGANTAAPPPLPPAPPPQPTTAPPPPTDLSVSGTTTQSAVHLQWKLPADADATVVYRSGGGGAWGAIGYVLRASGTSYTDTTVVAGTTYSYSVRASNAAGTSADSNIVTVTTPAAPAPPPPVVAPAGPLVRVAHPADVDPDIYAADRGRDCRAYDRTEEREVYGPHRIDPGRCTDLAITNGLMWAWVGNRGLPAFLNVAVWQADEWRDMGVVSVGAGALLGARLVRVTPEVVTVALDVAGAGEVFVSLHRGERMLRCVGPVLRWLPMPPTEVFDVSAGPGRFGQGLDLSGAGDVRALWPPDVSRDEWTWTEWWLPTDPSSSQPTSYVVAVEDSSGISTVFLSFDSDDRKVKVNLGAGALASAPQSFTAGQAVFVGLRFSVTAGLSLTTMVLGGPVVHVSNAALVDPGTVLDYFRIRFGATVAGSGIWETDDGGTWETDDGDAWEGVVLPNGVLDEPRLFRRRLTDTEMEALAHASAPFDGLPVEGDLVWAASFATALAPALTTFPGRVAEYNVDSNGLRRALVSLDAVTASGFGLAGAAESLLAAAVTTTNPGESPFDHQAQLAAANSQRVGMR